jgi:hypothetical protein
LTLALVGVMSDLVVPRCPISRAFCAREVGTLIRTVQADALSAAFDLTSGIWLVEHPPYRIPFGPPAIPHAYIKNEVAVRSIAGSSVE